MTQKNDFDKLLENNDGWIVTRNLTYTSQITNSESVDATDEELEQGNWVSIRNNKPVPKNKPKNFVPYAIYSKVVQLFLRDILSSEAKDNYFTFREISFIKVFLCGTITSVHQHKKKDCLVVDDGTGSIICFVDNKYIASANEKRATCEEELNSLLKNPERPKNLLEANQATRYELQLIPRVVDEALIGKPVQLCGKVKQHFGKKYIFIDTFQLIREDDDKLITYLEDTLQKYKNEYFKGKIQIKE